MEKKIVTIGGGGGHSQVLKGLRDAQGIRITGICPSTDSGGSTGILQKEYDGNGYVGDLTKCVTALCKDPLLAKALMYRYENGPLDSHSVKNLLFHALEKVSSPKEALEAIGRICGLGQHRIIPVTNEKTELHVQLKSGNTVSGETNIDTMAKSPLWNPDIHSILNIYLKPKAKASTEATRAIFQADYVVICPGDLYSSIIPVLLPDGMKTALKKSRAKIVLILNIMTKKGETDNYTASDFVSTIEKHLGRPLDSIICNNSRIPSKSIQRYARKSKVALGTLQSSRDPRVILVPLAMTDEKGQIWSNPDVIRRTLEKIISRDK